MESQKNTVDSLLKCFKFLAEEKTHGYKRGDLKLYVPTSAKATASQWKPGVLTRKAKELGILKSDDDDESNGRYFNVNFEWTSKTPKLPDAVFTSDEVTNHQDFQKSHKHHFYDNKFATNGEKVVNNQIPIQIPPTEKQAIQRKGLFSTVCVPSSKPKNTDIMNNSPELKNNNNNASGIVCQGSTNEQNGNIPTPAFKTASVQLAINDRVRGVKRTLPSKSNVHVSGLSRKAAKLENNPENNKSNGSSSKDEDYSDNPELEELMQHECMKNVDPKMVEAILNEVVEVASTDWNDIAGLHGVKRIIKEIIIWPMMRPDIFTGLRGPPKGILLFGPPGTGKTMIGRLISTQSQSTFFNISASSLTSKWIGDGEKMVRALFQVARVKQPAVIFIDEIDSILTARSDTEHESSRRLKTEFLIQFDGCGTKSEDRILVIGVTNRPQELDDAARRRLVKRIYIPLPDSEARKSLVKNLLSDQSNDMNESDFDEIAKITEGYSGADMKSLCQEAAYGPIRELGDMLEDINMDQVRGVQLKDFLAAQKHVKSSVAESDLVLYEDWDDKFGCHI